MLKRPALFTGFLCIQFCLAAQKKLPEQGPVTVADLQLKSCPFETDASAMILFDVQDADIDYSIYGSRIKTERKVRVKIFNENGYQHASIRIPYLNKRGFAKIKKLEGAVYNLDANGKISVTRLGNKDFFKEKAADYVGLMKFTFPQLKPGSIIEYSYTTIETDILYLKPWLVQDEIPIAFASRAFTTPVTSRVIDRTYGTDSIEQQYYLLKYDQYRKTTFYKENLASFKPEPYMSSINDYLLRVSFALLPAGGRFYYPDKESAATMWSALGKALLNTRFYKQELGKLIPGTEKIIDSARKINGKGDRIRYVYEEVKKRFPSSTEQSLDADSLATVWNTKEASSAEINYILLNLLEKSDITCVPVLVSTRNHGKVKMDFPNFGQLNGVDVLAVDSVGYYLLDASIRHQSYHVPPLNILNRDVLILNPDSVHWAAVTDDRPLLKQSIDIYADIMPDGKLEGGAGIQYFDYAKTYRLDTSLQEESSAEKFLDKRPSGLKITSSKQEITDDPADPLTETIDFVYEPQQTGDYYFIDPQILTARNKNPFLADARNTDIDLGCNQLFVMTMQIHFPNTFQVDHLPENTTIKAPDSSFFFKVSYTSDKENIYVSQMFEIRRALFLKDQYAGVKDFFSRMYGLMAKEIVVKKIK